MPPVLHSVELFKAAYKIFIYVHDERTRFVHVVGASFGLLIKERGIFMCSASK